jgi:phage terminase large subunit-like protein
MQSKGGKWRFSLSKAQRPIRFIENFCKTPTGRIGTPLELELFQKAWIEAIFGFVDENGLRKYQEVFIEVARKNGKTTLTAAIQMYMLVADGEGAPQIYNLANSGEQSSLCYDDCVKMARQSKALSSMVRKRTGDLYCESNMGFIKPLNSNPSTLDGFDPSMATLDEVAAMKTRDLYDLMIQAIYARSQPLIFEISTNGFVRNSIFDAQYNYACGVLDGTIDDERFLPFIYELDDREEWQDEACWLKANPGLDTIKSRDKLARQVEKARHDPSSLPTLLTKDFNIPQNTASAWLSIEDAVNTERYDFKEMGFKYGIVGIDAADTVDLFAAQMLMMRPGDDRIYTRSMYWIPESVLNEMIEENKDRDFVPYRQWIARGLMRTSPGIKVDKAVVFEWLYELRYDHDVYTYAIGYDPWHIDDNTLRQLQSYCGKSRCFAIRQGPQSLSQPMKQIKADYAANRIVDNHHPINEWCRMNVAIKPDTNGNIKPLKKEGNPRFRIDGFAAELDAYKVLCDLEQDYKESIGF